MAAELAAAAPAWGSAQGGNAVLLVSELVTNVLLHTDSAPVLRWGQHGSAVVVEVYDDHPDHPGVPVASPEGQSGRGLVIVDSIAHRWGSTALDDGRKVVWFELI